jgi:ElaB/YqjD/DUF883 family membrane-anchored ribosome-binding protein
MATTGSQGSAWQDPSSVSGTGAGSTGSTSSNVSQNAGATVDKIASSAHQAVDRIASAASSAAEQFGVKGDQMLEHRDRMVESTREYVRNNPIAAIGIALAAGFILSKIL